VPCVVFYVSGHGFGHASRIIEVVNALQAKAPRVSVHVRTSAPRWLFDLTVRGRMTLDHAVTDVGVVQIDSLTPDLRATLDRATAFHARADRWADEEARRLVAVTASLVVADLPPLALVAADRAGVPSVGLGNFTWDWIYEDYARRLGVASALPRAIRRAHGHAREAWRLPMHGGFDGFARVIDVPFVARHATRPAAETREALGLPGDRPIVLVSFGGYGLEGLALDHVVSTGRWTVVTTGGAPGPVGPDARPATSRGNRLHRVDEAGLYAAGFRYEDLVAASDVVVTKPGYGIVSECIANGTAIVYTSRGPFAEYEVLVAQMPRFLRCAYVDQTDLRAGRWHGALDAVVSAPPPPERPPTDGAAALADRILDWCD
jgi:hypothetical protein